MMPEAAFKFGVPIGRVWKDDSGAMRFEGVASSTALDSQKERMSKTALESMAAFRGVDLLPSHQSGALEELGTIDELQTADTQLAVKGTLDASNPAAVRLYERLLAGKAYGLSVGGRVTGAHFEVEKSGQRVRVLDTVVLDHIAVTRPGHAANPDAYLAIAKSAAEGWPEPETEGDTDMSKLHEAIAGIEADLNKAGARHSRADIDAMHKAMALMRGACGCAECVAAEEALAAAAAEKSGDGVAKSDASTSFAQNMREEQVEEAVREILDWRLTDTLRETVEACVSAGGDVRGAIATALSEFATYVLARVPVAPAADVTFGAAAPGMEASKAMSADTKPQDTTEEPVAKGADAGQEGEDLMKSIAARLDALEKTVGDRDATITELTKANETAQEELAKAQARVAELEAMPAAGGPASTAASEGDGKLGKQQDEPDVFAKSAEVARTAEGQREQAAARRDASAAMAQKMLDALGH